MLRIELDHRGNGKPGAHVNDVDLSGIDVAAEQTDRDEVAVTTRWRFGNVTGDGEGGTSTTWMTSTAAVALGTQLIEAGNRAAMRPRR